jgi:hypothetical protein
MKSGPAKSGSGKLRLGPCPDATTVRVTITLPTELKRQLDTYRDLHAQTFHGSGASDVQTLIPLMLTAFLGRDRVFQRAMREGERASQLESPNKIDPRA